MNLKRILICIAIIAIAISTVSCAPKGVNILEQNEDYVGEFYVPSSKKLEVGSALSVLAEINENGYKVKSAIKTESDDASLLESYKIDCYGLNIELFRYSDDSEKFKEISETGKYCIKNTAGQVLREYETVINGHFVMIFSGSKDYEGNDHTEDNKKISEIFKAMDLE